MAINRTWGFYLIAGVGVTAGALALLSLTRNNKSQLRKTCVSLLSHGLDIKDKIAVAAEVTKESIEDLAAEARYESDVRKMAVTTEEESTQPETVNNSTAKPTRAKAAKKTATKRATKAVPQT